MPFLWAIALPLVFAVLALSYYRRCHKLGHKLERMRAELRMLRFELEEREAQKKQQDQAIDWAPLVCGIAHEINNPLSYLLANLEVLREDLRDLPLPQEQAEAFAEMIDESFEGANRVSLTIDELQRFARPPRQASGATLGQVTSTIQTILGATLRAHADFHVEAQQDLRIAVGADKLTHLLVDLLLQANESVLHGGEERHRIDLRIKPQAPGVDGLSIEVSNTASGQTQRVAFAMA